MVNGKPKFKKQKSKEEREKEGQAFIGAREKEINRVIGPGGEVTKRATQQASANVANRDESIRVASEQADIQDAIATDQATRETEAQEFLGEREFFKEGLPQKTSLAPPPSRTAAGLGNVPFLGNTLSALTEVVADNAAQGNFGPFGASVEDRALLQDPETAREVAIQQIQEDTIQEGLSADESFGAIIEGIPILGGAVAKWANGLISTPGGNARTVKSELASERERASVLAEKAATGKLGNPQVAFEELEKMDLNVARLEQRIKLLIRASPTLQADPDEVNLIEEQVLRTKERIFIAKQAAASGLVTPASDSNIFLTLRELKGGKDNE